MTPEQFELHAKIEDAHWWFVGRRQIIANIVATAVYDKPPMKLVDIGCGTGGNIGYFKERFDCIGVDIRNMPSTSPKEDSPILILFAGEWARKSIQ